VFPPFEERARVFDFTAARSLLTLLVLLANALRVLHAMGIRGQRTRWGTPVPSARVPMPVTYNQLSKKWMPLSLSPHPVGGRTGLLLSPLILQNLKNIVKYYKSNSQLEMIST